MFFRDDNINKIVKINGMSCNHCKLRVENALKSIKGVKFVEVNLEKRIASISLKKNLSDDVIKETIEDLGFSVEEIKDKE